MLSTFASTLDTAADARERTAELLRFALARGSRRLRQHAGAELTPSRAAVLSTITRLGPLTPSEIAEQERISRPTTTRLVARLKEQGLVDCVPDPDDGRSYRVSLSADGSALSELRRARKQAYLATLLDGASPEELEVLEQASRIVLRLLEETA